MARNFLGNIKGPQGPKGDKGDKGVKGDKGEKGDKAELEVYHKEGNLSLVASDVEQGENIFSVYNLDMETDSDTGAITMDSGIYLINNISLYSNVSSNPGINIRMYHNDEEVYRVRKTHGETIDFSFVVQALKGDKIYFTLTVVGGETIDGTMYTGPRNKLTITKISG